MTTPTLAGPEQSLVGPVEPKNDELIVVFQNGRLEDVYDIGTRAGTYFQRVKHRLKRGKWTYARLLRSDIKIGTTVHQVALADGWELPYVQLHAFVALNQDEGYGSLRRRLLARGLSFMEALTSELHGEMQQFVRDMFAGRTHEEVKAQPIYTSKGVKPRLLKDLYVVDSVHVTGYSSDPKYEEMLEEQKARKVDHEVIERAKVNAAARDITVVEWENPELLRQAREQAHERFKLQMEAELESRRIAVDSKRIDAELDRAHIDAQANVNIAAIQNARELSRAKGVLPNLTVSGRPAPIEAGAMAADEDAVIEIAVPERLGRDSRLIGAWKRALGPVKAVRGLVQVEDDGRSLILMVLDESVPGLDDLPVLLSEAFPGEDVVILPESPVLMDWVIALVQQRAPKVMAMEPIWLLEERDDVLHILVGSNTGQAMSIVKAVQAPGSLIVPGLDALLPYDDVVCSTAMM
ncbi:hypothetical protein [Blastococcus deserti]|uniref:SPFH domain/Band 7 family protein n=1 Tax=Blastococcus deserti TaxID=2259033 RepID=A0ABW4X5Z3_9ACTN